MSDRYEIYHLQSFIKSEAETSWLRPLAGCSRPVYGQELSDHDIAPFYSPGDGEQAHKVLPEQLENLQLPLSPSCEKSKMIDWHENETPRIINETENNVLNKRAPAEG